MAGVTMKRIMRMALAGALILGVSACVTINIYFPAAAAEKAADAIIDNVWQLDEADGGAPARTPE